MTHTPTGASRRTVDYDQLAPTYDRRYMGGRRSGTAAALTKLARQVAAERVLEVGCGTGRWLAELKAGVPAVWGLDLSTGMLEQAQGRALSGRLVRGRACHLPFANRAFDLVYCVNAIHHFGRPQEFIAEASRLLFPGGVLAIVGMDPHGRKDDWYVYRYFDGVYETDLARFPPWETVREWMARAGLQRIERCVVDQITDTWIGRDVLADPFLQKHACSQLALLSEAAYADGLSRIEHALEKAEPRGQSLVFLSMIEIALMSGRAD
jgi:ubiquinone/menaquinone biosynthesis C-methylase UbiE